MDHWKETDNHLEAKFEFENFIDAWAFMNKVALLAEKVNHHPKWTNVYNRVEISLTTHDEGSQVTWKDWELAEKINNCLNGH